MKQRAMDKIELNYIIEELKIVEKGFFRKAYLNGDIFKIKTNKASLMVKLGKAIWKEDKKVENLPNSFVEKIRKELDNHYIESIRLKEGDRVVEISFNDYFLFIEIFSKGNIILTDKSLNVIMSLKKTSSPYEVKVQPFSFSFYVKNFPEKPVGASLSFLVGKRYKDYILSKLNIEEKTLTKEVDEKLIEEEINKILAYPSPSISKEGEKVVDYALIADMLNNAERVSSLSEACSLYYSQKEEKRDAKREKTIEKMKERIEELKKEEVELKNAVEFIRRHQAEFSLILESIRKNREKEAREIAKSLGIEFEINKKEKKIVFKLSG